MGLFVALIVTWSSLLICLLTLVVVHTGIFVPFLLRLGRDIIFTSQVLDTLALVTYVLFQLCSVVIILVGVLPLFPFILFYFQFLITQCKLIHFPTSRYTPAPLIGNAWDLVEIPQSLLYLVMCCQIRKVILLFAFYWGLLRPCENPPESSLSWDYRIRKVVLLFAFPEVVYFGLAPLWI